MRTLHLLSLSLVILGFDADAFATGHLAKAKKNCNDPDKQTAEQILKRYGITGRESACPKQNELNNNKECLGNVKRMYRLDEMLEAAHTKVCAAIGGVTPESISACRGSKSCWGGASSVLGSLRSALQEEKKVVDQIRGEMDNVKTNTLNEAAIPTANDINESQQSPTLYGEAAQRWNKEQNGDITGLNGGETGLSAMQAITQLKQNNTNAVDDVKSPYLREPLAVAASAIDMKKQMNARSQEIDQMLAEINTQSATLEDRDKKIASAENSTAGGNGSASQPQAASTDGGNSDLVGSAGGAAGAAGGLAAGMGGADGGSTMSAFPNQLGRKDHFAGTNGGVPLTDGTTTAQGQLVKAEIDGKAKNKSDIAVTSSASLAPGADDPNNIKNRLRAKLQSGGASINGGVVTGEGGAAAGSGAAVAAKAGSGQKGQPQVGEEFSAPFQATGSFNNGFSMAGSETESAVKNMMMEFQGELGDRAPASFGDSDDLASVLGDVGTTLFMRTKETHNRCIMRGLVTSRRSI